MRFDTLLIDGDVIAFISAAAVQRTVQDSYGNVKPFGDLREGEIAVDSLLARYVKAFAADGATLKVCLSDPDDNWRYQVRRDYKDNRDEDGKFGNRPLLLLPLKKYLREKYGADHLPGCEADDYLSLLMTRPQQDIPNGHAPSVICIGRDKDFKSIPGWHYQLPKTLRDEPLTPFYISAPEADRWHLVQTIAGDVTDGFKGVPGIGMKRAEQILDEARKFVPEEGVLTRGKNKGTRVIKWHKQLCLDPWEIVISCYERAGLGEIDALDNARMAHLLRHGEFNHETGEVTLWTPHPNQ